MDTTLVRDARDAYFAANGFSEGAYTKRWVTIQVGPLGVPFPNRPARQRAVPMHDLHHLATGYATSWVGEGEQAAWELGAGCGKHLVAWALDLGAFGAGLVLAPRRTYRAFVRGRHSKTLYDAPALRDEWLALSVDQLRAKLRLTWPPRPATSVDQLAFAAFVVAACSPVMLLVVAAAAIS